MKLYTLFILLVALVLLCHAGDDGEHLSGNDDTISDVRDKREPQFGYYGRGFGGYGGYGRGFGGWGGYGRGFGGYGWGRRVMF